MGLLMLAASAAVLVIGAELFVENAAGAGRRLGVTALAVGLLLAGAEPEETVTTVIAALNDRPALAVGDAIGANLTTLASPLEAPGFLPAAVGAAVLPLAAVALGWSGRLGRLAGLALVAAYALFFVAAFR